MSRSVTLGASTFVLALCACVPARAQTIVVEVKPDNCCPPARRWVEPVFEEKRVQVWVDAVYRTVCTRVWTPPVYKTVYERVWRPAVTKTVCERVWVPDRWETRTVIHREGETTYTTRERVLVNPGHHETRSTQVVVTPAHCETLERQEMVSPGSLRRAAAASSSIPMFTEPESSSARVTSAF